MRFDYHLTIRMILKFLIITVSALIIVLIYDYIKQSYIYSHTKIEQKSHTLDHQDVNKNEAKNLQINSY